ncbi:MAG TPA: LPXTG cell wall anchor domain-containing protein [Acidimicrobiales bacterium]|nr:LPXTG cell wall anchor domain-containing protein [Acidimicrobiales bacterium]
MTSLATPGAAASSAGSGPTGDLLVAVDFTKGGELAGRRVHEWHCRAEDDAAGQLAAGTVCNPPAHGPSVPHYEEVTASVSVSANVTVVANAAGAVACGGWACRKSSGTQVSELVANTFLEGGIDLAGAGLTGCTSTMLVHTRSSDVFESTLKDFVGPVPFDTCLVTVPTTTTTVAPTTTTAATTTTTAAATTTTVAPATTTTVAFTTTTLAATTTTTAATTTTTVAPVVAGQLLERAPQPALAPGAPETRLPRTGSTVKPLLIVAGLALMMGGALVLAGRPRRAED